MMTATIEQFVQILRESKLLNAAQISDAQEKFTQTGKELETNAFADFLVEQDILTSWQKYYLLKGKTKGFFIGSYKIRKIIGRGGNSYVYLGEHIRLKQQRAIKVLARSRMKGQQNTNLKRFIQEARETAKLDHPNVIRCFDIGNKGELYYLVMEYVKGKDLHRIVRDKGPLDFALAANCIFQAAQGLKYIHENGLVHRDIKPGNIFATTNGTIKILDLGLARLDRSGDNVDPSMTIMHNDNIGTADYLAPEQALNSHLVDHRVDIYGLGCTLYYLLVGKPPFPEGTVVQRIAQHQSVMPQEIYELRPDCPAPMRDLCWHMIQKRPEDRVQTYDEVINRIKHWKMGTTNTGQSANFSDIHFSSSQLGTGDASMPLNPMDPFEDPLAIGDISDYAVPGSETLPLGNHGSDTDVPHQLAQQAHANPGVRGGKKQYWNKKQSEEAAYQKFLARERLKTMWVLIGLGLGIAIAIATFVVLRTTEKVIEEETKLPPPTAREL